MTNKQPTQTTDGYGTKYWALNGKYHRENGPAIEWTDGSKQWLINGKLHRTNGPAAEYTNGYKEWYLNDKLHRTDGPAIEWESRYKEWWINGKQYTKETYFQIAKQTFTKEQITTLTLKYYDEK